eukprot:scaffold4884_cov50-Attheya_sp.AAC.5
MARKDTQFPTVTDSANNEVPRENSSMIVGEIRSTMSNTEKARDQLSKCLDTVKLAEKERANRRLRNNEPEPLGPHGKAKASLQSEKSSETAQSKTDAASNEITQRVKIHSGVAPRKCLNIPERLTRESDDLIDEKKIEAALVSISNSNKTVASLFDQQVAVKGNPPVPKAVDLLEKIRELEEAKAELSRLKASSKESYAMIANVRKTLKQGEVKSVQTLGDGSTPKSTTIKTSGSVPFVTPVSLMKSPPTISRTVLSEKQFEWNKIHSITPATSTTTATPCQNSLNRMIDFTKRSIEKDPTHHDFEMENIARTLHKVAYSRDQDGANSNEVNRVTFQNDGALQTPREGSNNIPFLEVENRKVPIEAQNSNKGPSTRVSRTPKQEFRILVSMFLIYIAMLAQLSGLVALENIDGTLFISFFHELYAGIVAQCQTLDLKISAESYSFLRPSFFRACTVLRQIVPAPRGLKDNCYNVLSMQGAHAVYRCVYLLKMLLLQQRRFHHIMIDKVRSHDFSFSNMAVTGFKRRREIIPFASESRHRIILSIRNKMNHLIYTKLPLQQPRNLFRSINEIFRTTNPSVWFRQEQLMYKASLLFASVFVAVLIVPHFPRSFLTGRQHITTKSKSKYEKPSSIQGKFRKRKGNTNVFRWWLISIIIILVPFLPLASSDIRANSYNELSM